MSQPFSKIPPKASNSPSPFTVAVPETELLEFRTLLKLSKIAAPTYESLQDDSKLGITHTWISEAKEYWLNKFDWRECEARMNSVPHFKVPVHDGENSLNVHFIGLFSEREDAIPVLLLHGWPGSFLEFLPILSLIKGRYTPSTLPYHFVVPSLPGYAFSSPPPINKDFRIEDIARVANQLMLDLGFGNGYVVQGGDIGSKVGRVLAAEHDACRAIHLNFGIMPEPQGIDKSLITEAEHIGLQRASEFGRTGSAYALLHATRPSTISFALASSPLALLSWIGEKFIQWTDDDTTPSLHTILESVTLYWLTETFPHSIYPYRQLFTPGVIGAHENPKWHINKPFGFSWFPKEIAPVPKVWVETTGNLIWWREHTKGGHFAAIEQPEILLGDLTEFIATVWK